MGECEGSSPEDGSRFGYRPVWETGSTVAIRNSKRSMEGRSFPRQNE